MDATADQIKQQRLATIYSDSWQRKLKRFVASRYQNFGDWEGWFEEAHQNLALKINQLPVEREVSEALIFAVFKNELVSVKRAKLGYPRPRKWLQQFGELGQSLFEWFCLQKLTVTEIKHKALQENNPSAQPSPAEQSSDFLATIDNTVKLMIEKKECEGVRPMQTDIDDTEAPEIRAAQPSTEEAADLERLQSVLELLLGNVDKLSSGQSHDAKMKLANMRKSLQDKPILSDTDILILRCYYFQGMSQNDIAQRLKQPLQHVVRQREAAIKQLRAFMEANGLDRNALL